MTQVLNNLFECDYPKFEGEIVWKAHPVTGVRYNNFGHIENDEYFDERRNQLLYVYEAFSGKVLKPFSQISFVNMNHLDTRIENLFVNSKKDKNWDRIKLERQFVANTVDIMLEKAKEIEDKCDPIEYFELLGIPQRFITAYTKKASKK